jgi:hypothetical protein
MTKSRILVFSILLVLAVAGHGICTHHLLAMRNEIPQEELRAQALMVNPKLLQTVSGEFKGLLADYLLLKASVFLGGTWEMTAQDWDAIALMFKQSLTLDPLFFQTGYYIQGILSWRKTMHAQAVDLLLYHADHRDWDWEPRFYVGVDYFYYLHDPEKAALQLAKSATLDGAPPIVGTLGARLLHRSSQTIAAIAMLKAMHDMTDNELARKALSQRLEAYQGVRRIEIAITQYIGKFGHPPKDLGELTASGILPTLPTNPFGDTFFYEPDTGRVFFDTIH